MLPLLCTRYNRVTTNGATGNAPISIGRYRALRRASAFARRREITRRKSSEFSLIRFPDNKIADNNFWQQNFTRPSSQIVISQRGQKDNFFSGSGVLCLKLYKIQSGYYRSILARESRLFYGDCSNKIDRWLMVANQKEILWLMIDFNVVYLIDELWLLY